MAAELSGLRASLLTLLLPEGRSYMLEIGLEPKLGLFAGGQVVVDLTAFADNGGGVAESPRAEVYLPPPAGGAGQWVRCAAAYQKRVLTVVLPNTASLPPEATGVPVLVQVHGATPMGYLPFHPPIRVDTKNPAGEILESGTTGLNVNLPLSISFDPWQLEPDTVDATSTLTVSILGSPLPAGSQIRLTLANEQNEPALGLFDVTGPLHLDGNLPLGTTVTVSGQDLVVTLGLETQGQPLRASVRGLRNPRAPVMSLSPGMLVCAGVHLLAERRHGDDYRYGFGVFAPELTDAAVILQPAGGEATEMTVSLTAPVAIPPTAGVGLVMRNDGQDAELTVREQGFPATVTSTTSRGPFASQIRVALQPTAEVPAGQPLRFTLAGLEELTVPPGTEQPVAPEPSPEHSMRNKELVLIVAMDILDELEYLGHHSSLGPTPRQLAKGATFMLP